MGKTIIVYAARQIGKTTPVRKVVSDFGYSEFKTAARGITDLLTTTDSDE